LNLAPLDWGGVAVSLNHWGLSLSAREKGVGPSTVLSPASTDFAIPVIRSVLFINEAAQMLLASEEQFETWLSGSQYEDFTLVKNLDSTLMRIVQSGTTKEDLRRPD
jgi:hypothetical protein